MKKIILLAFVLFSFINVTAQQTLTLEECVQIALKNNHDHKQVLYDNQIANEKIDEAYGSSVFPSIKGSANYSRAIKRPEFIFDIGGQTQRFKIGSTNSMSASIDLEQPLFSGAMFLAIKVAKTFAEISSKAVDYSTEELVVKVKQSYYTYLLSNEFVKLVESQTERAELNRNNTESMYNSGLASEQDYIKAKVQYQNLIPALSRSKNQKKKAENNLKLIMGLANSEKIKIDDSLDFNNISLPEFEEGVSFAYENNKLIKQSELDEKLKDLVSSYEFTGHLPSLYGFGNYQTQAQEEDDNSIKNWKFQDAISVGLNLKIPIFSGFATSSKVEQAELEHKKSLERLEKIKSEIKNEFENIYLEIKSLIEQKDAYKSAFDESQRGYEITTKKYKVGVSSQLEVLNSMVSLIDANTNYLTTIHDYYIAHAKLDLIMGKNFDLIEY
ncbi:MAG: TolC family protein [Ignavibacteriae bacterium]|nr:TolC family protein [Ignavibacteriota bacterium]